MLKKKTFWYYYEKKKKKKKLFHVNLAKIFQKLYISVFKKTGT